MAGSTDWPIMWRSFPDGEETETLTRPGRRGTGWTTRVLGGRVITGRTLRPDVRRRCGADLLDRDAAGRAARSDGDRRQVASAEPCAAPKSASTGFRSDVDSNCDVATNLH